MKAHQKLGLGDRVILSKAGERAFRFSCSPKPGTKGVVVGYGRDSPYLVRIKRDDCKGVQRYHMSFWRVFERHDAKWSLA